MFFLFCCCLLHWKITFRSWYYHIDCWYPLRHYCFPERLVLCYFSDRMSFRCCLCVSTVYSIPKYSVQWTIMHYLEDYHERPRILEPLDCKISAWLDRVVTKRHRTNSTMMHHWLHWYCNACIAVVLSLMSKEPFSWRDFQDDGQCISCVIIVITSS